MYSLTCISSSKMNSGQTAKTRLKVLKLMSNNFYGCTSGFQKYAHVLNKPIGSCFLKYAGIGGGFITTSVGLLGLQLI
jgi:hypothetical protein